MADARVVVDFVADTTGLHRGLSGAGAAAEGMGSKLKGLGKVGLAAAGAAGFGALVAAARTGAKEFADSQRVAAQTAAVIKSTGGAANVSAKQVASLAEATMKKTGIDDEAIASAENMLLTFRNVHDEVGKGNNVFTQATGAITDMSVALDQDLRTSALQVGKALNDPVKGMTALHRAGVDFTPVQKEMIKGMVESGDVMGAQKIILKELNAEFGGSAEAAGKTLPGQLNILRETFNNLAGDLAGKLAPALQATVSWLITNWPAIAAVIKRAWAEIQPALAAMGQLVAAVFAVVRDNWGSIRPIVEAIAGFWTAQLAIMTNALKLFAALLRGDWGAAWGALKGIAEGALDSVTALLKGPLAILGAAADLGKKLLAKVRDGIGSLAGMVADKVAAIGGAIGALPGAVASAARNVGENIYRAVAAGIGSVAGMVKDKVLAIADALPGLPGDVASAMNAIGGAIFRAIVGGIGDIGGWIKDKLLAGARAAIGAVNAGIGRINSALSFTVDMPLKLPDIHINPPDIPPIRLAKGGIVTGPTMAMIGEAGPEAVIPLGGASGPGPIEVRVFIGDDELRSLVRYEVRVGDDRLAQTLLAGASH